MSEYKEALKAMDQVDEIIQHDSDAAIMNACDSFYANYADTIRKALSQPSEREILFNAVDKMGWDEINAYHAELKQGHAIYEDAGSFFMRAIKRLFGIAPRDELRTYQKATRALILQHYKENK